MLKLMSESHNEGTIVSYRSESSNDETATAFMAHGNSVKVMADIEVNSIWCGLLERVCICRNATFFFYFDSILFRFDFISVFITVWVLKQLFLKRKQP